MERISGDALTRLIDHVEGRWGTVSPLYRRMMENFATNEGFTRYPYLDIYGNATIGFGTLLKTRSDFLANRQSSDDYRKYNFVLRDFPGSPPSVDGADVARQIGQLMSQQDIPLRARASRYQPLTSIGWTPDYAVEVALDKLATNHDILLAQFPDFDSYPSGVREALMDIAWQRGPYGLAKAKNTEFGAAVRDRNWEDAVNHLPLKNNPDFTSRTAWRIEKFLEPDPERMYPVSAYPGYQAPPPAADGTYGQDGYPGYAPAAPGMPSVGVVSKRRAPTLEELYAMSDEDFDANWDRVMQAARGPSIL